jgi:geranylgeranyl diphosphate synthase type II
MIKIKIYVQFHIQIKQFTNLQINSMQSIDDLRQLYRNYAAENHFGNHPVQELYRPLDYILSLGGKQMRPVLALMAAQLFSDEVEKALPPAYGVELFHNFSLLHDDIMDEADLRRGKATVHKKFDVNTAILSGDVMLVYAYQYVAQVDAAILPEVIHIFNETAIGVCEGQQMDVNFETRTDVSLEEYIRMIELKTSVLLHGAMKIGALVAGAEAEAADHVAEFGRNMGIAFQLQDDYLDSFGDQATFGKRIGGDIVQNKKTYLFLTALQQSDEATQKELLDWYTKEVPVAEEETKIEAVKQIFRASGALEAIVEEMEKYRLKALDHLNQVAVDDARKQPLLGFLEYIMQRQH